MAQGDYEVFDNEFLVLKNESSHLYSWHDVALTGLVYFPNFADARIVYRLIVIQIHKNLEFL